MSTALLLFDTTHHALWAEQVAVERGIPVQVVPAPAGAVARCDLALECRDTELDGLLSALREVGVPCRPHRAAGS